MRHNLFRFATSELSHSAFWAWVLQSVDAKDVGNLAGPRRAGLDLIRKLGFRGTPTSVEVKTEVSLPGSGRVDICALLDYTVLVVIENKVSAIPDRGQLQRYKDSLDEKPQRVIPAIISCSFDRHVRREIESEDIWHYLGANELLSLVEAHATTHSLLDDYIHWLRKTIADREALCAKAWSGDISDITDALVTREGQWEFLATAVDQLEGEFSLGVNRGGTPWTQFWFCNPDHAVDGLFYRVDVGAKGPYLSFRQYQSPPSPTTEAKMARRDKLRRIWAEVIEGLSPELVPGKPGNRGTYESEIGVLLLRDNAPSRIIQELPRVHQELLKRFGREGFRVAN